MHSLRITLPLTACLALVVAAAVAQTTSLGGGYALRPEAPQGISPADVGGPAVSSRSGWRPGSSNAGSVEFASDAMRLARTPSPESIATPPGSNASGATGLGATAPGGGPLVGADGYLSGRPIGTYLDLDVHPDGRRDDLWFESDTWDWQLLPTSLLYKSYLAGPKEARFATQHMYLQGTGWLWEPVLGARIGIVRYGNHDAIQPQGWQFDVEGAALARLSIPSDVDVTSVDFRGGLLLTRANGPWRTKFGYYHLSSHLGDEFLLAHVGYPRLNYVRDAFVLGEALYLSPQLRVYAEATWAFNCEYAQPWEFQFGADWAPAIPTGIAGAPFFAINGYLRQEVNYGGNLTVQAGWAWRGDEAGRLLRFGVQYINGKSVQFSFYENSEQEIGLGLWYDY